MSEEIEIAPAMATHWLSVESLNLDAQGVARRPDGKVVFIEGALPFEQVSAHAYRSKNNWEPVSYTHLTLPTNREV